MYALNRVQIIGYLTQDPDIRQTPSGQSVGDLNIMSKQAFKNAEGQTQPLTSYHNVVVWRGLADICGQYLRQGSQIYISGRLQTDSWEAEDGQKRYKTKIIADEMIMLDSRNPVTGVAADSNVAWGLNRAEVIGNLTKDPEMRTTPNGTAVATIGVATSYSWKDKDGQDKDITEYHNIVLWEKLAEEASKYLQKGRKVYINGRVQTRSWETPSGDKKYTTEIIADQLSVLGTPAPDLPKSGERELAHAGAPVSKKAGSNESLTPDMIPAIKYESDIKPEDLPF